MSGLYSSNRVQGSAVTCSFFTWTKCPFPFFNSLCFGRVFCISKIPKTTPSFDDLLVELSTQCIAVSAALRVTVKGIQSEVSKGKGSCSEVQWGPGAGF